MKRSLRFALGLLSLLAAPIHAQEPTPTAPWPPDPALIFADGVTWEEVQPANSATQSTPRVIDDFERNVIRVRDEATDTWQEFPYPPGVEHIAGAWLHMDSAGRVWIQTEMTNDPRPSQVFVLDPATGEYSPPPTVCDGRVIQAEPGESTWVAAYAPDTWDHATLCHSATGEQRDVLPAEMEDWVVGVSPDEDWITLVGENYNERLFYVYAYPLAGERLTTLGTVEAGTDAAFGFCGWVSDQQGVLCHTYDRTYQYSSSAYRAFDITQPDSLEYLFSGWENIFYDETNAQFVSLYSENYAARVSGSRNPAHPPCALTIYDADGLHEFELDYECRIMLIHPSKPYFHPREQVFYRQDNMLYFFTIASEEATITELRSYDLDLEYWAPGQTAVLAVGEIEAILSTSPDQRYIILVTDTNHELDVYPDQMGRRTDWQITIVDRTQQLFYGNISYLSEPMNPGKTIWLDDHTVVILSGEVTTSRRSGESGFDPVTQPATIRRITLNDDGSYDMWLHTLDHAVFLRDALPAGYRMTIDSWEDNTVQLTLRQGDDSITYRLDLSALWTSLPRNW